MRKVVGRLVGLIAFLVVFACVVVAVIVLGTAGEDGPAFLSGLIERQDIGAIDFAAPEAIPNLPRLDVLGELAPGDRVYLVDRVSRRPLVANIPAPQQVVTAPRVVGANAFYAILMALIFGVVSTVLGNMIRDEEPRLRAWLRALGIERAFDWLGKAFRWTAGKAAVRRGCLTMPLVVVIFALYGIIFAFLEEGTLLLSRSGALLAVMMAASSGLVSFGGDIARRIAGRMWHTDSRFRLYPANLGVAVISVGLSRVLNLSPGIAFGTPGGADLDLSEDQAVRREGLLSVIEVAVLIIIAGLGWGAAGAVLAALAVPVEQHAAGLVATLLTAGQNLGLVVYFVALETLFFELLPLAYGTGQALFRWSKPLWVVMFVPIAFLFNHTLLNPQSGFLDSFTTSNVRFMWVVLLGLVWITGALWFYFNVIDDVLQEWVGLRPGRGG